MVGIKKTITMRPIAFIRNERSAVSDDHWGDIISEITLADGIPEEAFRNIESFSHLEIIYYFDKLPNDEVAYSRRPRGNPDYPDMGIFAQRNKDRPNRIGLCTVELLEHKGRSILVKRLDAIDGTPVLDIKPVFREFSPQGPTSQPAWVSELTRQYW